MSATSSLNFAKQGWLQRRTRAMCVTARAEGRAARMKSKISATDRATLADEIAALREATPRRSQESLAGALWQRTTTADKPRPADSRTRLSDSGTGTGRAQAVDSTFAGEDRRRCLGAPTNPGSASFDPHAGHRAAARLARHPASGDRAWERYRVSGQEVPVAVPSRPPDNRQQVVGAAVLRSEGQSSGEGRWSSLNREPAVARFTRARARRRASSRTSTRCTPSV